MRRVRRFIALPSRRRRLLVEAFFVWIGVRAALLLLPFSRWRPLVERINRRNASGAALPPATPADVLWAVETAGRRLRRGPSCLPRSLALQHMLLRQGWPSRLRIGVRRDADGALVAHAWVEALDGEPIGESDLNGYSHILEIGEASL